MRIKKVVIVGGGSSGWMTAAALCKQFPEMEITLVESKDIKTIGVGESTLYGINQYLSLLGLEDSEWMPECDATYKVSISFEDFREKGFKFQYPFGGGSHVLGSNISMGLDCFPIMKQLSNSELTDDKFAEFYNPISYLANKNKLTFNEDESLPVFHFETDTAYHFDSTKFGIYLRDKICKNNGVVHLIDEVKVVNKKDDTTIDNLVLESGEVLEADLFIDCTGFKSLLLESVGSKFISYKDGLINDRALATKLNYDNKEEELQNVTNCTAIENGWVWNIPLWDRIGSGYVYSSDFVSREQAEIEFRNHLKSKGKTIPEDSEILDIEIKHGRHTEAWVGNVLGIGLSYAFVEPLESTGLLTTHENIYKFVKTLERRNGFVSQIDKTTFNLHLATVLDGFKAFVEMHYALSMRDDTEYWRHVTSIKYDSHEVQQLTDNIVSSSNYRGLLGGMPYIAAGMGYLTSYRIGNGLGAILEEDLDAFYTIEREFEMFSESLNSYIDTLPSTYEFLKQNIYS
jgi:tryptophan halogenase